MKAVVFVDVQNDFVTGALGSAWAQNVVPEIVKFAEECKAKGYQLYATRDTHEATAKVPSDFRAVLDPVTMKPVSQTVTGYRAVGGYLTTLEGQKLPILHCIEGTDGWQIDSDLMDVLLGNCTFINKPTFGSYDLVECIAEHFDLKALKSAPDDKLKVFDEIIICGFCTSICVLANAVLLRAKFPNMKITVKKDLCADGTKEAHDAALAVFKSQQIDVE